jgi:hypothetical protein
MIEKEKVNEELLKKLLKNLLEERLSRLEKRNIEQTKDIKFEKDAYKKQELLVKKLCSIKIEPKKLNQKKNNNERGGTLRDRSRIRDRTPNNIRIHKRENSNKRQVNIRSMTPDVTIRKKRAEKKDNTKTEINVVKKVVKNNNNKIPSYMMNTSSNANKNRKSHNEKNNNTEKERTRIKARTPDIKKKVKNNPKKIKKVNNNIESNLKLIDLKIEDMKEHVPNEERISEKIETQKIEIKTEEKPNIEIKEEEKEEKITFDNLIEEDKSVNSIASFLDKESQYNFYSSNKKLMKYIKDKLDDTLTTLITTNNVGESLSIQDQINSLKLKYENEQFEAEPPKFALSRGTVKAIEFLNNEDKGKIFQDKELLPPLDSIIFIYRIFFQFLKDNDIKNIENDHLFWVKASDYIIEQSNGKIGDFFRDSVDNFEFTAKNIFEVKKLIYGKEDQLKPASFSKICPTTGFLIFLIKDALEYCGVILSTKKNIPSLCLQYLEYINEMQNKLKNYIENIREWNSNA